MAAELLQLVVAGALGLVEQGQAGDGGGAGIGAGIGISAGALIYYLLCSMPRHWTRAACLFLLVLVAAGLAPRLAARARRLV